MNVEPWVGIFPFDPDLPVAHVCFAAVIVEGCETVLQIP
jgi:hypothetical protein